MNAITRTAGGFLTCLAAGLLATAARAQEAPGEWRGIYVGGGGMYSTVSVEVDFDDDCHGDCDWWGDYSAYDQGDGDYGWALRCGRHSARSNAG